MPTPRLLGSTILTKEATEDSMLPCFATSGDQTAPQLRERFQQGLTHPLVAEHVDKLIDTSLGSTWTRLYDSVSPAHARSVLFEAYCRVQYQYYSQSIL
jgi:hypothetical protein